MIRVLLAEDQAMMRDALAALLGLEPDIEVLATVADGESALREAHRLQPDILVTDIEMPGLSGLDVAQRVQRFGGEHVAERCAEQRRDRSVKEIGRVFRHPGDQPVGRYGNQEADGLDGADQMDRFAIAIGQVDRLRHHARRGFVWIHATLPSRCASRS